MATRRGEHFYVVVNGATKHGDIESAGSGALPREIGRRSYEASRRCSRCRGREPPRRWRSWRRGSASWASCKAALPAAGRPAWISRSGYTGEDGFEISVAAERLPSGRRCAGRRRGVKPIGLGARDSLRLEAGLPLYGHDIDRDDDAGHGRPEFRHQQAPPGRGRLPRRPCGSSPRSRMARRRSASASTSTAASRSAKARGCSTARAMRSAGSPAAAFRRQPAAADRHGLCRRRHLAEPGTALKLEQRGKLFEARVAAMPFVPHRYHRKGAPA